jgi:hypothetical protein
MIAVQLLVALFLLVFLLVLAVPVLLLVAVALGPVTIGIICAVGFGLMVFALWSLVLALGAFGRSVGRAGSRHMHHQPGLHHP